VIDAWIHRPPVLDPATLPVLLEEESDDDRAYWESYSVWRPGRLLTTQRDDLLSEMAAEEAEREKREQIEAGAYGPQSSTEPEHPSRTANATRSIAADE
jgi:hypothetical protein